MSEDHDSPYEETAAEREASRLPARRGWFYYVALFFIVVAGICFVLVNNLKYVPGPLPPPVHQGGDK